MPQLSLTEQALSIALMAHGGQVRKTDDSPYVIHPIMVSQLLARHGFSDSVCAAALIHDVLEDTCVGEEELRKALGDEVVDIVVAVTEDKVLTWEERKETYLTSVRQGTVEVKAVSIADKIHNAESVLYAHGRAGSAVWASFNRPRDQKLSFEQALLTMFRDTWDHPLVDEYEALVLKMRAID